MEVIKSKDNALVKEIKKLKSKKHRQKEEMFLVEGFRFVKEAILSSYKIQYIFISEDAILSFNKFGIEANLDKDTKVYLTSEKIIKELTSTKNPQGIVAVVKNNKNLLTDRDGFYMLVDKVQDPGNLGTIIRTANAAGALGVIITEDTVDVYNEKTLRATMGSIFKIPIIEDKDFSYIKALKGKGFRIVATSLETEESFYSLNLKEKVILCVGNEGNGISKDIYDISDVVVKIPMPGDVESLNVAVASAVMMFEAVRQKYN